MNRARRFARLAAAQDKIQLVAGAAAAVARQKHDEAMADLDRMIRSGSGDGGPVPASLVHRLFNTGRRTQRIVELSAEAGRLAEAVRTENCLARQLQRVTQMQIAAAKARAEEIQASELLDAISLRITGPAQASKARLRAESGGNET